MSHKEHEIIVSLKFFQVQLEAAAVSAVHVKSIIISVHLFLKLIISRTRN